MAFCFAEYFFFLFLPFSISAFLSIYLYLSLFLFIIGNRSQLRGVYYLDVCSQPGGAGMQKNRYKVLGMGLHLFALTAFVYSLTKGDV